MTLRARNWAAETMARSPGRLPIARAHMAGRARSARTRIGRRRRKKKRRRSAVSSVIAGFAYFQAMLAFAVDTAADFALSTPERFTALTA